MAQLEGDETRRAHRADQVRRVHVHRGEAGDAALGQVFENDVRSLQAVLIARVRVVGDLDDCGVAQRDRVLVVVPVDARLDREARRHRVAGLVAAAGRDLDGQRPRREAGGRECRAAVVGRPLEVRDLAVDGGLDGHRLHLVVEGKLQSRAGIDLHPVLQGRAVSGGDGDDARDDDRGEGPVAAVHVVAADVEDRPQVHGVARQLDERLTRGPRVLVLSRHGSNRAVRRGSDRKRRLHDVARHRAREREHERPIGGDVLLTVLDVGRDRGRQRVLVGEIGAHADQHD
jgi:hypothetical protein